MGVGRRPRRQHLSIAFDQRDPDIARPDRSGPATFEGGLAPSDEITLLIGQTAFQLQGARSDLGGALADKPVFPIIDDGVYIHPAFQARFFLKCQADHGSGAEPDINVRIGS